MGNSGYLGKVNVMDAIGWLLNFAYKHEELKENFSEKTAIHHDNAVLNECFASSGLIPEAIKDLTQNAILCLALFIKQKMDGDSTICGFEIVKKAQIHPGNAPQYLQGIDELGRNGWLNLICDVRGEFDALFGDVDIQTKVIPYCWLQAKCEYGFKFTALNSVRTISEKFASNEEYIDVIVSYINTLANDFRQTNRTVCGENIHHLPEWEPDSRFVKIQEMAARTVVELPAYNIMKKLNISGWQYLFLMGILGKSEKVVEYDFADINDVVNLFASSYTVRSQMREHIVGKKALWLNMPLSRAIKR